MRLSDRIGCRMKLHDLHVMMSVVEAGSMNKAAALLNTTQPAISRSIAELERSLGVRVLDRDQRGVAPTEYGRALLNRCVTVFDELRQGVKNIEHLADATAGEIRIGGTGATSAGFVSAVVDQLSRQHPRISVHGHSVRPCNCSLTLPAKSQSRWRREPDRPMSALWHVSTLALSVTISAIGV